MSQFPSKRSILERILKQQNVRIYTLKLGKQVITDAQKPVGNKFKYLRSKRPLKSVWLRLTNVLY